MRQKIKGSSIASYLLIGFISLVSTIGCFESKTDREEGELTFIMPTSTEEIVTTRCAPWLIVDPRDTSEIQHNEVVNLIIDQAWDVQKSAENIFYHILKEGHGRTISWGDRLEVQYTGYDLKLKVFDSTFKRKTPFRFYLGNVIQGWNQGLPLIREGGRIILLLPSYKAYGANGFGHLVAPDQHLIFDVEVLRKIDDQ